MNDIKISVIMTTMNCREYLERSIYSFLRQTLKEMELICVDGNSKDGTREYIEYMSAIDNRIRIVNEEGIGIGGAKNTGIRYSKGEFVTFLDADDFYVDERALNLMYSAAKKNDVKICGGLRTLIFNDGSVTDEPLHRNDCINNPGGVLIYYRDKQYDYHFHSYIYDRKMLLDGKIFFAEARCYDDTHFFIRAMLKAEKFYVVPVELYRYLVGEPYCWGMDKTEDALIQFIDQLHLSADNNLERLHYLTVLRMNYEYAENFIRNIRNGDLNALKLLIEANDAIDIELITTARHESFPVDYLETMLHRDRKDCPIRCVDNGHSTVYVLEPLWEIMNCDDNSYIKEKINKLEEEIKTSRWRYEHIEKSLSYRIGMAITFIPRKLRKHLG
ncbi:glycosyltransferase family 2 protein [Butyrivibrio fibrisolvens]|uniref:glycosyltransferase family 2 protein n=1 Tax=Butyrivibrio fibrisolvens TaxID=831 RepID=UPI00040E12FF|nr:glycosyltransferase family 2 protein [Butyrivibrio fibrisolvens]